MKKKEQRMKKKEQEKEEKEVLYNYVLCRQAGSDYLSFP